MQHVDIFEDVTWLKLINEFNSNQNPIRKYLENIFMIQILCYESKECNISMILSYIFVETVCKITFTFSSTAVLAPLGNLSFISNSVSKIL